MKLLVALFDWLMASVNLYYKRTVNSDSIYILTAFCRPF